MLFLKQILEPDSYLKPNERCKTVPTHLDVLPKPHPCGSIPLRTAPEYCSHLSVPYLLSMTFLHKDSISNPYHHKLLPSKAWLKLSNFLMSNPPCLINLHTLEQSIKWTLCFPWSPPSPTRSPSKVFSNLLATLIGIGKREKIGSKTR